MKIIFMGTSNFGSNLLQNLIKDDNLEIIAVYSKEPTISGRGNKIIKSPIHQIALENNIKTITPKNFKTIESIKEFTELQADLAIVVSYGLILPKEILKAPKYCCINIHPSLLPKWRGAAPMQRTIMNGDKESAMSLIQMNEDLDSGDIIYQEKILLQEEENFITLSQKMSDLAIKLTKKAINDIKNQKLKTIKQDHKLATYAKKIDKNECEINWQQSAEKILQQIRGLNGNLGAYFIYKEEKFKIFDARIIENKKISEAGSVIDENFTIQCQDYGLQPLIIQRSGKKPMNIKDFLLGFKIAKN